MTVVVQCRLRSSGQKQRRLEWHEDAEEGCFTWAAEGSTDDIGAGPASRDEEEQARKREEKKQDWAERVQPLYQLMAALH